MIVPIKTPVNSIQIPPEYVKLCRDWHDGQFSMFYAVTSTGNFTTGRIRPRDCDTDEQWYLKLWRDLNCEAYRNSRVACRVKGSLHDDAETLIAFEEWTADTLDRLTVEYGLEGWEG